VFHVVDTECFRGELLRTLIGLEEQANGASVHSKRYGFVLINESNREARHRVHVIIDSRAFNRVYKHSPIYKEATARWLPLPAPRKEVLYVEDSLLIWHSTNDGCIDAGNGER
jgi:hypothetical protein